MHPTMPPLSPLGVHNPLSNLKLSRKVSKVQNKMVCGIPTIELYGGFISVKLFNHGRE